MKTLYWLLLLAIATTMPATAQRMISGAVRDAASGEALIGANVILQGTTQGTVTDMEGAFSLSVPTDRDVTLSVSYAGYLAQSVPVGPASFYEVRLAVNPVQIKEVIVTGYQSQKKSEITGAIASVQGEVIKDTPTQSLERLIQGRASGVMVQPSNGIPGSSVEVRIRGLTSVNAGTSPLYIVDGVQVNESLRDNTWESVSPLAFINPEDIESVEILKDAASASIYGSQAANGVILITTKRGKQGKTRFSFTTFQGINKKIAELDLMSSQELVRFRMRQYENDALQHGLSNPVGRARWFALRNAGFDFSEYDINNFTDVEENVSQAEIDRFIEELPTTDWFNSVYRDGRVQNYQFSASGGSNTTQFYISANYNNTEAQMIANDFERVQLRTNIDHQVGDRWNLSTKLNLSTIKQNQYGNRGLFNHNPSFAGSILPWNPIRDETGGFTEPLMGPDITNPVKTLEYDDNWFVTNQLIGSVRLDFRILPSLTYSGTYGLDYRDWTLEWYEDPRKIYLQNLQIQGVGGGGRRENFNYITTHQLQYNTQFRNHHRINALLVWEYREEKLNGTDIMASDFPNELFRTLQSAANPLRITSFFSTWKNMGTLLNTKYALKDRYHLNASIRYDGSSRFGKNSRFGWFPSFSASWRIAEEKFFPSGLINDLKLRVGWGITGNNRIGNFESRALVTGGNAYLGQPALFITRLGNDNLSWENQKEWNVGLDFGLWDNRINGAVELYRRVSHDLLFFRDLHPSSGYFSIRENVGDLLNRGVEFLINATVVNSGGWRWKNHFNIAFQGQKLLRLHGGRQNDGGGLQVGYPVDIWYELDYAGVNPANGRAMWYDRNGDLTYRPTEGDEIGDENDDRKVLGRGSPDVFGGLSSDLSYKGLTLSAFFIYEHGKMGIDALDYAILNPYGTSFNALRNLQTDTWQKPGDVTRFPMASTRPLSGFGYHQTSVLLQQQDFIRLKLLTLSYDLPAGFLKTLKLTKARVYVQGTNLLTFTQYTGLDPESSVAVNSAIFPNSKLYTAGVEINF